MKISFKALTAVLVTSCISIVALGLSTYADDPKAAKEPSYKYVELLNADSSKFKLGDQKVYVLKGNVKMRQGDTVLTADSVEYNQDTQIQTAVATGNLKITDPQNEITGAKGTTYFREKRAVLDGSVKVIAKPKAKITSTKDSLKENLNAPAVITCDQLEYFYKNKLAKLKGNLKIVQNKRIVTAQSAVYQVKDELITLSGNVSGHDEKNQTFSSPADVIVSLKDGDEWIEMKHATGTFRVELDEEEQGAPAPAEKPAAAEPKKP